MAGHDEQHLSRRERQIIDILYERGRGTAAEVQELLPDPPSYSAVRAMLRTLEEKGHVGHREEGKAHRYFPLVERRVAGRSALARLIDTVFNGSPELLLTQLVSDRDLSDDQIKKLRRLMDARLRGDKR